MTVTHEKCFLCKAVLKKDTEWYGVEGGGDVQLSFGYGSRHDVMSFDGVICDLCADRWVEEMDAQTRVLLAENYKRLKDAGVQFGDLEDWQNLTSDGE